MYPCLTSLVNHSRAEAASINPNSAKHTPPRELGRKPFVTSYYELVVR